MCAPAEGQPLVGDGVTPGIVRVGATVRRPVRPFTATVHAYLAHLHRSGFTAAPVPLGTDGRGREVLTYVSGDVPREPLPEAAAGEDVLAALARLVRRLHEASQGWAAPADAVWGSLPGSSAGVLDPLGRGPELVGRRDYCPGNVVFRRGLPAALIDFDLARPTTRLAEIANALYWWVPLLDPRDRAPAFVGLDAARRVAVFADAYGMDGGQRADLVPMAVAMIDRFHAGPVPPRAATRCFAACGRRVSETACPGPGRGSRGRARRSPGGWPTAASVLARPLGGGCAVVTSLGCFVAAATGSDRESRVFVAVGPYRRCRCRGVRPPRKEM